MKKLGGYDDHSYLLATYWRGDDAWWRERTDEFPDMVGEMQTVGLTLDASALPPAVRALAGL